MALDRWRLLGELKVGKWNYDFHVLKLFFVEIAFANVSRLQKEEGAVSKTSCTAITTGHSHKHTYSVAVQLIRKGLAARILQNTCDSIDAFGKQVC